MRSHRSAGRSVTIVGEGQARVSVEVPLNVRGLVTAGAPASVGLVGTAPSLRGQVTSVSVLPTSASGNPSYTAVVTTDDPRSLLKAGSKAEVTLPLRTVENVVTVPMSALTKITDTVGSVQVVADATATTAETVQVTIGALGSGRVEIRSGLEPGRLVVLADRREPVPGGIAQYQTRSSTASPTATRTR